MKKKLMTVLGLMIVGACGVVYGYVYTYGGSYSDDQGRYDDLHSAPVSDYRGIDSASKEKATNLVQNSSLAKLAPRIKYVITMKIAELIHHSGHHYQLKDLRNLPVLNEIITDKDYDAFYNNVVEQCERILVSMTYEPMTENELRTGLPPIVVNSLNYLDSMYGTLKMFVDNLIKYNYQWVPYDEEMIASMGGADAFVQYFKYWLHAPMVLVNN